MEKNKKEAIFFIILSGLGFALMSFFIRLSGDLPTVQKAFFRNSIALLVVLIPMIRKKKVPSIPKKAYGTLFLRCSCGTVGLLCNFYAVDHMNIADANMLNKISPFFAILASYLILKEKVDKVEWATVFVAFAGVLFIIKPSFRMDMIPGLTGLLGGIGAGFAYTFLRKASKEGVEGPVIVCCFSLFSCLVCVPFMILDFHPMSGYQLLMLLAAGGCAAFAQLSVTKAYSKAPAKEISVFDYAQIIFAAMLGMIFLNQVPDIFSLLGYVIIIGTAVFRWKYSMKKDAADRTKA